MKKFIVLLIGLLVFDSCSDQLMEKSQLKMESSDSQITDEYRVILEKARWGDGEACMKLADFYRLGIHVKSDFVGMTVMLSMAERYDDKLSMKDYLHALPEEDNFRLLFDFLDNHDDKRPDHTKEFAHKLIAKGAPDGYVIDGFAKVEEGDTLSGIDAIRYGAEQGSSLGEVVLCIMPSLLSNQTAKYDIDRMVKIADKNPYTYKFLGDLYARSARDSVQNEELAVIYYQKADKSGFLGRDGARWLLNYYTTKQIQVDEKDIQRLHILSKE